jgi:hypothetical protein
LNDLGLSAFGRLDPLRPDPRYGETFFEMIADRSFNLRQDIGRKARARYIVNLDAVQLLLNYLELFDLRNVLKDTGEEMDYHLFPAAGADDIGISSDHTLQQREAASASTSGTIVRSKFSQVTEIIPDKRHREIVQPRYQNLSHVSRGHRMAVITDNFDVALIDG